MHTVTIKRLILLLLFLVNPLWSQEDDTEEESLSFIELLANSTETESWGCSSDDVDDEGNTVPNGTVLNMDENGNISRGEPIAVKAYIMILKDYDGYAQVSFGNTIFPFPDGGRFYTNKIKEDDATLIGSMVEKSENKFGLPGGIDFGPTTFIWFLDRDIGRLMIGGNDQGIEMYGCIPPPDILDE